MEKYFTLDPLIWKKKKHFIPGIWQDIDMRLGVQELTLITRIGLRQLISQG